MDRTRLALILMNFSAILVLVGGAYDLLVPSLPSHQVAFLRISEEQLDPRTAQLLLAIFRALGGSLIAVGVGALFFVNGVLRRGHNWGAAAAVVTIGVAEGTNAVQMYRVGSPFWAPLVFIGLLVLGVALAFVPEPAFRGPFESS